MNALFLPILIPLGAAIGAVLLRKSPVWQRRLTLAGVAASWAAAAYLLIVVTQDGTQAVQAGNWPAPFGITLVADGLSSLLLAAAATAGTAVMLFAMATIDQERTRHFFYPLMLILFAGVSGAFLTGDLFNLFVFFEVLLIASYALTVLGSEPRQLRSGVTYLTINALSSALFVAGVAVLYGLTGTLNLAHMSQRIVELGLGPELTPVAGLFLVVFGIKAAIFPLYFWLPDTYPQPPLAVTAFFAGLLTKVGVYALYRLFTLIFIHDRSYTHEILLILAGFTMLLGVLGAIAQNHVKNILTVHIVSQIGYMILGVALFTPLAIAGGIFHIIHNMVVKTALFLISGIMERITGTQDLARMGGLVGPYPVVAALFFVAAMALAGIPPLSGFFSKWALVQAGIEAGRYGITALGLFVSVLTLFSMVKIWRGAFWGTEFQRDEEDDPNGPAEGDAVASDPAAATAGDPGFVRGHWSGVAAGGVVLVVVSLAMSVGAGWLAAVSMTAATELLDPSVYINSVLGGP